MFRTVPVSIIRSFHCAHSNGVCHTGLLTAVELDQDIPFWSCSQAVSKPVWHIPLLCAQCKTRDDGKKKCPKHVEFYSKNNIWEISASDWFYYKKSSLVLSFHLHLSLQCSLFLTGFPSKTHYIFILSRMSATYPIPLSLLCLNIVIGLRKYYESWRYSVCNILQSTRRHFLCLATIKVKCSPQNPLLQYHQSMFLP
jgi:hypothetical protein